MKSPSQLFRVIGFDARYPSCSSTRGPWTVDGELCPSALDNERLVQWLSDPGLQSLWVNFSTLQATLDAHTVPAEVRYIAVTWSEQLARDTGCYPDTLTGPVDGVFWWYPRERHRVSPKKLGDSWQFLGYDVADAWLLSGIWHCGFEMGLDVERLDQDYYALLNCHGLFDELARAVAFSRAINPLAREHAPFTPYGVWIHASSVP